MDIQRFSNALPHVNAWIAATLDAHRGRARFVGSIGFSKLPMYFPVQLLASVRTVEVSEIPVPPLTALGLPEFADFEGITPSGITYLDTVFVLSGQVWNESLYFHELVHAVQWQYLGPDNFLLAYAVGLYQDGYYANPVETMAYELQAAFDHGHPPFDVAPKSRVGWTTSFLRCSSARPRCCALRVDQLSARRTPGVLEANCVFCIACLDA